jgi:hypothetical protein
MAAPLPFAAAHKLFSLRRAPKFVITRQRPRRTNFVLEVVFLIERNQFDAALQ